MNKDLKIKVCGMREPANIHAVSQMAVDFIGFIFWKGTKRNVEQLPTHAGIIPDAPSFSINGIRQKKVGVFVDEMPQTIITRVYNYHLDYVQLHGNESPVMIDNLRRSLVPDIAPDIKIIKALSIREADDVKRWREYEGCVDMFLFDTKCPSVGGSGTQFDWSVLSLYDGNIPFLLSGGIGPDDVESVRAFSHPMCVGIDLNSRFEDEPALKNVERLAEFIESIRK